MRIQDQVCKSLKIPLEAFSVIARIKGRWMYLLPFVIYLLTFTSGFALTNELHSYLMDYFHSLASVEDGEGGWLSYLFTASSFVTWIVIKVSVFILLGIISGYLTLIVLSPVFAWLSEKVEEDVEGVTYPFELKKFIKDVVRAIIIAGRNGVIQMLWTLALFLLSFVPFVNLVTAPLLFIITSYFYGFSFLDYTHERMGLNMKQSIARVREMKFAATILGGFFLISYMIPWIGALVASLASFNLVVAGTIISLEAKKSY